MRQLSKPSKGRKLPSDELFAKTKIDAPHSKDKYKIVPRSWEQSTIRVERFKTEFRSWAKLNQGNRCAYCSLEMKLVMGTPNLDHFIPKSKYGFRPSITFGIYNLMLSCVRCNSVSIKGEYDPLENPHDLSPGAHVRYQKLQFKILHPYFDNINSFINGGYDGINQPRPPSSNSSRGIETIKVFKLNYFNLLEAQYEEYEYNKIPKVPLVKKLKRDLKNMSNSNGQIICK